VLSGATITLCTSNAQAAEVKLRKKKYYGEMNFYTDYRTKKT
jgi:hypothetical protein